MNDFQHRLQNAIDDKRITASELSRISGVGKSDISNYLKGKYLPKQDKCYLLADALGVDPGWLMTGFEQQEDDTNKPVQPQTYEAKILARGIDKLPPVQREQALAVVKAMFAQHPELFEE